MFAPSDWELQQYAHFADGDWAAVSEKAHRALNEYFSFDAGVLTNGRTVSVRLATNDAGGWGEAALKLLTGNESEVYPRTFPPVLAGIVDGFSKGDIGQLENELSAAMRDHAAVVAGTGHGSRLVGNHYYAVIGLDEQQQIVTLYNPWGFKNHNLAVPPGSEESYDPPDDAGLFTVSMTDFVQDFNQLAIASVP